MKKYQFLSATGLLGFSSLAMAHPSHGLQSAYAGFMHPFTGWDHLLMMVAVGVWAAKTGKKAVWKLPMAFILAMFFGVVLSFIGIQFSGVETSITASVIAMGLLLMMHLPIKQTVQLAFVSLFAVFHGMAHGIELNFQLGFSVAFGMLFATLLLHGVGILLGSFSNKFFQWMQNGLAITMVVLGGIALF